MAEIFQKFEFTTKKIPQVAGTEGSHWEKIPLASFPPTFDISIPDSTANAVAAAMSNIKNSFSALNSTLQAVTQSLQDASCSVGDLADSLKNAQLFADQFANANNTTRVYVRQIGIDPVGNINSQQAFISKVQAILNDTGNEVGKIPKIVPAEIALDPTLIANALGSGQSVLESAFGKKIGAARNTIQGSVGLGLKALSNDINFQPTSKGGGFSSSTISYNIASIIKINASTAELSFESKGPTQQAFSIKGSTNSKNNGTFKVLANGTSEQSSLGKTFTKVKYTNALAITETTSKATVIFQGTSSVSASNTIRSALEQEGLYGQKAAKKSLPITTLIDILIKHSIIGINPDQLESDRSIALERLSRLATANTSRVGGIVLVGKAPNLASLARKVQALSHVMEWLKPLGDKLAFSALASATSNESGIDFDPTNVDLNKLKSKDNIAKKDADEARKKVESSGALNHEMIPLSQVAANPPKTEFNAWRNYSPIQLMPGLETLGKVVNPVIDSVTTPVQSAAAAAINGTMGGMEALIEEGKGMLNTGISRVAAQSNAIDQLTEEMNALNDRMVSGLNWLKNQVGVGPISLDAHLIGPKLNLTSNSDYLKGVEAALSDITDPNRPTFGPSASTSVLENQNTLKAALQGTTPPTTSTKLWFGLVLVVVGKNREDLGEQLHTLAGLLSMDPSAIDLPPKPKISFPGKGKLDVSIKI